MKIGERMAKSYVKFSTPKDISDKLISAVSIAKDTGKIRKGINETTKAIESGKTKLIVLAEDVEPEEIVMHIPGLCEEKGVPLAFVPNKADLGKASGLSVGCGAVAIDNAGGAAEVVKDIISRLNQQKANEKAKEEKAEVKPEKKKESKPKEEKKKEDKKEEVKTEKKEEKKAEPKTETSEKKE